MSLLPNHYCKTMYAFAASILQLRIEILKCCMLYSAELSFEIN